MKQFGIIFGAVLAAIIAAVLVLYAWLTVSSWEDHKSNGLGRIAHAREEIVKDRATLDNYQSQGDRFTDSYNKRSASRALESEERQLARDQFEMIRIFDDKPFFRTPSEREEQQECMQGVEDYRTKHPGDDLSVPSF